MKFKVSIKFCLFCIYFKFYNELVYQWQEVMQFFGFGLFQQVFKNDRYKGQDFFFQIDYYFVEVLFDFRLYQLFVGGDIYGLQEDFQQVGEGFYIVIGLYGLLIRKFFVYSVENIVVIYEKNCLDVNMFINILINVLCIFFGIRLVVN